MPIKLECGREQNNNFLSFSYCLLIQILACSSRCGYLVIDCLFPAAAASFLTLLKQEDDHEDGGHRSEDGAQTDPHSLQGEGEGA